MASEIRVNSLTNRSGLSTVTIADTGVVVAGIVTASAFSGPLTGNATGLTGTPNITVTNITAAGNVSIAGTLTYEDVTSVDAVGLSTFQAGIHVTGGLVGIGTDNPVRKLDVDGTSRFTDYIYGNSTTNKIYVNDDLALSATKKLYFDTGSNTYIHEESADNLAVVTGGTEKLRITSAGKVDVLGGYIGRNVSDSFTLNGVNQPHYGFQLNASATVPVAFSGYYGIAFATNSLERLRIRSQGPHLLIGTGGDVTYNEITESSSNAGLVIGSGSMGNGGIVIRNSSSGTGRIYFADNSGNDTGRQRGQINYYHNGDYMMFATASTERLRITSDGLLDVSGGIHVTENITPTSGRGIEIFEASAGVGQIQSYNRNNTSWDELKLKGSEVRIHTGSTNALTLDLQKSASTLYGTSDGILNLDTTDGRGSFIRFKENGSTKAWIGSAEGMGGGTSSPNQDDLGLRATRNILFSANGGERLRIHSNGSVTKPTSPSFAARLNGNINISTSGNTDLVFNLEYFDNGNNYNNSNGRFTAPVAGKYFFGVQLYVGFSVTAVRVMHAKFNKNGSVYAGADLFGGVNADAGTHYHPTGCASMMVDLAVNDYVTFNLGTLSTTGSGNATLYGTDGTRFFGYLVG